MNTKKLTKEQAITEHRKMWNWIADQLENHNDPGYDIHMYKVKYIKENFPHNDIRHNCFCCHYAVQENDGNVFTNYCINCPLIWGTEDNTDGFFCKQGNRDIPFEDMYLFGEEGYGLWNYAQSLTKNHDYEEAAKIARQIANLPEKEIDHV